MTIREALNKGSSAIASSAFIKTETPALDAGLLLAEALNTDRTRLLMAANNSLSENSYTKFQNLLKRRLNGECIAYITGHKEFYGLDFTVNPYVLVPRPETETLVEAALEAIETMTKKFPQEELKVLDLCTGSGAVAIALKHEKPGLNMWAQDISAEALAIARLNCKKILNSAACQSSCDESGQVHFMEGDLFSQIENVFHLIITNPPYIPSNQISSLAPEVQSEPQLALDGGDDGLCIIRRIIKDSVNHLLSGGVLLMEADPVQMDAIEKMLVNAGFYNIKMFSDLAGQKRVIKGQVSPKSHIK